MRGQSTLRRKVREAIRAGKLPGVIPVGLGATVAGQVSAWRPAPPYEAIGHQDHFRGESWNMPPAKSRRCGR
jgi:hypothetical protein